MSAGGRYIPVNSAYASPVIEKAGLGERRGVRGALLRKDTAEAGESTFCLEFIMGSVSLYHASAHDILTDKDVSTPSRNLNSTSSAWRPSVRNTPSSATAGFEGVLGSFGSPVSTPSRQKSMGEGGILDQSTGQTAWKERERTTSATDAAAGILPGSGGGPGWGKTGRWRSAAQQQEDEDALKVSTGLVSRFHVIRVDQRSANQRPNIAPLADKLDDPKPTVSTAVIPSTTPVAERDHQLEEPPTADAEQNVAAVTDDPQESQARQPESSKNEPETATIEWFYRDPFGNEQGKHNDPKTAWFDLDLRPTILQNRSIRRDPDAGVVHCQLLPERSPATSVFRNGVPYFTGSQGRNSERRTAILDPTRSQVAAQPSYSCSGFHSAFAYAHQYQHPERAHSTRPAKRHASSDVGRAPTKSRVYRR